MIALDEDALVCDFAETYHIYDLWSLPVAYAATLAVGLRENSRIKQKASGINVDINTILLAHIADNTAINVYFKTEDAQKRVNSPTSLLKLITKSSDSDTKKFESGVDFMNEWRRINGN